MNTRTAFVSALLASSSAMAATELPVTWAFNGHVTGYGMPGGLCYEQGCQDLLSSSFSGRVTFNLYAPDLNPDPGFGSYLSSGGPYGLHIDIGGYSYDTSFVRTTVGQNLPDQRYMFMMDEPGPWFNGIGLFAFFDYNAGVLKTDSQLPEPPLPWAGGYEPQYVRTLGGALLGLRITDIHSAPIASPVPEPETYAMFVGGVLLVSWAKRHRKGKNSLAA